ncbi:TatD family hydrolase [Chloroflexota bacterium]
MYRLVETHAHLDEIEDLEEVIDKAKETGLIAIVAVGQDIDSNRKVLELARLHKSFVYPALGLHPWNIGGADIESEIEFIEANINEAVGIGEVGLDYHKRVRAQADKALQAEVFRRLLGIAAKHNKPVMIHSRYAWRDAFDLVEEVKLDKAVFHWYTGTSSVLRDIVNRGYYLSATPAVEYHEEHRRAIKEIPLGKLMLETDCPVVYRRGTEDEFESRPSDVLRVLKGVSVLRGIDEAELAEVTTANALEFFGLQEAN